MVNCMLLLKSHRAYSWQQKESTFYCFWLARYKKKKNSIEDLHNFLTMFLKGLSLKPSFSKQHKTDLEHYPPAPTSTAKSSTYQPLDSMIVFKVSTC